ncbi:MAG TPA: hypothetical protein PKV77_06430 [Bacteroidales bacterium]|nr:hypothetical protein [Bacteroidales bacterium]
MDKQTFKQIAEKLRKLEWLECVHSTFIEDTKANKSLRAEYRLTCELRVLCEKEGEINNDH